MIKREEYPRNEIQRKAHAVLRELTLLTTGADIDEVNEETGDSYDSITTEWEDYKWDSFMESITSAVASDIREGGDGV